MGAVSLRVVSGGGWGWGRGAVVVGGEPEREAGESGMSRRWGAAGACLTEKFQVIDHEAKSKNIYIQLSKHFSKNYRVFES